MSALNATIDATVAKKVHLFEVSWARFVLRGIYGGAYLAIGTAFAAVAGAAIAPYNLAAAKVIFALFFGCGLYSIVVLNGELATSNMMYFGYGRYRKKLSWPAIAGLLSVTTVANLLGVALVAAVLGASASLGQLDSEHLIAVLAQAKVAKPLGGIFVEAIGANFVVAMAVLGASRFHSATEKAVIIIPLIAFFVALGLDHVIANFCLVLIAAAGGVSFSVPVVLAGWAVAWLGNLIGGGVLIGMGYAWLNDIDSPHTD